MTTLDKDGITVTACGKQAQSQRRSSPSFVIAKSGRDQRDKVFITEKHIKCARLGRESPIGGAIYDLPSTLNPKPEIKFASGTRPDIWGKKEDSMTSNDALCILVDSQPFRYPKQAEILIGTEPRGKLNQAELMKAHSAAFFGRGSPGPAAVGEAYGPNFAAVKARLGPARKFGIKTKLAPDWTQTSTLPPEVGPGRYPRKDVAIGPQHLTQRRNQSVHAFPQGPKFAKVRSADTVSQLDAARSCFGNQPLGKNRSEPSINFNCDTRKTRDRTMVCMTELDRGPVAAMAKPVFRLPTNMPCEKEIHRSGFG